MRTRSNRKPCLILEHAWDLFSEIWQSERPKDPSLLTGLTERLASPWLDLLLPLSLSGLLWERSGNPAGMVLILVIWCGLKFLRWLPVEPVYGVLVGVLVVSLSAVIHPISGSAPTDLMLVLLAFVSGAQADAHGNATNATKNAD